MKLEDLDEESKKKLKEELLQEMKKDESTKTKETIKEAIKELDAEKKEIEGSKEFAFFSIGALLISAIVMFLMGHIYWGIGLAVLTIFQIIFIRCRKKINPILFNVLCVIEMVLILIVGFVIQEIWGF